MIISTDATAAVKIDTIKRGEQTLLAYHYKIKWALENNIRFTENRVDTNSISKDGFIVFFKKDVAPSYSDKVLIPAIKMEIHFPHLANDNFCDNGVWSGSRFLSGAFPNKNPVHFHELALSYWQWRFWRIGTFYCNTAVHYFCRRSFGRALVPDWGSCLMFRNRNAVFGQ